MLTMDEQNKEDNANSREFLTAMEVAPKSGLAGRSVTEIGLDKLTGVFLVSIDRPWQFRSATPQQLKFWRPSLVKPMESLMQTIQVCPCSPSNPV